MAGLNKARARAGASLVGPYARLQDQRLRAGASPIFETPPPRITAPTATTQNVAGNESPVSPPDDNRLELIPNTAMQSLANTAGQQLQNAQPRMPAPFLGLAGSAPERGAYQRGLIQDLARLAESPAGMNAISGPSVTTPASPPSVFGMAAPDRGELLRRLVKQIQSGGR